MANLTHKTTKVHYEEYATITGGEARPVLRKIVMDLIGNDIEALKEAYLEDKHLNNIDKVLKKAGTLITLSTFDEKFKETGRKSPYHKQRQFLEKEFQSRCIQAGIRSKPMLAFIKGNGGGSCDWFMTFDMQAPAFVKATSENRKLWKEIAGGYHSGGVSNSTICSGLKHIMIFDVLGCELIEEER